jgi:perosamine synthetase
MVDYRRVAADDWGRVMGKKLALEGGTPVREKILPYGRQWLDEEDIQAVIKVLRSDWLTTGPKVAAFEQVFADFVGAREAVAVSSGTAALHAAMYAIGIGPGDEVVVPPMTFAASANCVVFQGGTPVFADVDPDTLLLDPAHVEAKITPRTKAILAVDYTGQPCDYDALRAMADRHGLILMADACHALGGSYKGRPVGSLADLSTFSFHPVKHVTTGEGGTITADDLDLAQRMRVFRNHGITSDHRQREQQGSWFYEMVDLGYNYRLTDLQCALGMNQLRKLPGWVARRQEIARRYDAAFTEIPAVKPLGVREDVSHAYHLYVIRLNLDQLQVDRARVFVALRAEGIGVNVHYIPVHLHPFYRERFGTGPGLCPVVERAYERLISLPMFPRMSDQDANNVIVAVCKVIEAYQR